MLRRIITKSDLMKDQEDEVLDAGDSRPAIAIRCTNHEAGMRFYREYLELCAKLLPLEYDRPKVYIHIDNDSDPKNSSFLKKREFDILAIPEVSDKPYFPILDENISEKEKKKRAQELETYREEIKVNGKVNYGKLNTILFENFLNRKNVTVKMGRKNIKDYLVDATTVDTTTPIIGILGGMGPEADGYTLQCLVRAIEKNALEQTGRIKPAIYLMSDPSIPRNASQLMSPSGVSHLGKRIFAFCKTGAHCYGVPSNTFHVGPQFGMVQSQSEGRFINIIDAVSHEIKTSFKGKKIGLLATHTTAKSGIYATKILESGAIPVVPDDKLQEVVNDGILAMKSGDMKKAQQCFREVSAELKKQGAEVILLGCTEIPLALEHFVDQDGQLSLDDKSNDKIQCVDSADILARAQYLRAVNIYNNLNSMYRVGPDYKFITAVNNALCKYLEYKGNSYSYLRVLPLFEAFDALKLSTPDKWQENLQKFSLVVENIATGRAYVSASTFNISKVREHGLDTYINKELEAYGFKPYPSIKHSSYRSSFKGTTIGRSMSGLIFSGSSSPQPVSEEEPQLESKQEKGMKSSPST